MCCIQLLTMQHFEKKTIITTFLLHCRKYIFLFFQNNTVDLDFDYFVNLFEEYYLSDDPSDLGNFINGKLVFDFDSPDSEDEPDFEPDPGLLDHKARSSTSINSMDDDLVLESGEIPGKKKKKLEKSSSVIRLHDSGPIRKICNTLDCCRLL